MTCVTNQKRYYSDLMGFVIPRCPANTLYWVGRIVSSPAYFITSAPVETGKASREYLYHRSPVRADFSPCRPYPGMGQRKQLEQKVIYITFIAEDLTELSKLLASSYGYNPQTCIRPTPDITDVATEVFSRQLCPWYLIERGADQPGNRCILSGKRRKKEHRGN